MSKPAQPSTRGTSPSGTSPSSDPSDRWLRAVLETAPDAMVIVGADERIRYVNAQTERLFSYERSQLLGENLDILIPERLRRAHSGHVGRFLSSPGTRPMGSGVELFGRKSDGTELTIEVSLSPVATDDGLLVSAAIRDISERKRTEARATLAAERLGSAIESVQEAFALFDASDHLVLCNSAFRALLGESVRGALVGRSHEELLDAWLEDLEFEPGTTRESFRDERMAHRQDTQCSFHVRTRDGRAFRVMDRRTAEGGIVRTIWDLTELETARKAAEAASAAKSEFLSSMSHELRTPLNAVLGFAQLLRRDRKEPLSARHLDRITQILDGGEHLLRLIDDILDLSRIEAGGLSLSTEPVSVEEVLQHVRVTLEPLASKAGLTLTVQPSEGPPPSITADRVRFAQILMNFGSNAIKYNRPNGKVELAISRPDSTSVRVTVSDTGMGIPAEKQDKLFQPFQRAGQETGSIEGTGIGLVITKRLAELMGGTVGFRSVSGVGSQFWVDLPVHRAAPRSGRPMEATRVQLDRLGTETRHVVLYVEDNPANVLFMRDLLGSFENIELVTAPTAELGVSLARARSPAVIIMDINLPGMSGLEALNSLRAVPETRAIPVIALTAAASDRDRRRGEGAGFFRYLTKPVRVDELETALAAVLNRPN